MADWYNHRIQAFTAEGRFLKKFGRRGKGRGEVWYPSGVAIDSSGMVYVSEVGNDRVSFFFANFMLYSQGSWEGREYALHMYTTGLLPRGGSSQFS